MTTQRDGGFVTLEHVMVAALGLVLFTWAVNLVLLQYARAVTRLAVDEGVRAGAVAVEPVAACHDAARAALADLADGPLGRGIEVTCDADSSRIRATAVGSVTSWVPGVAGFPVDAGADAAMPEGPP